MVDPAARDLRSHEGKLLNRAAAGEHVVATRDGESIAEVGPLPHRPLPAGVLLQRRLRLPVVNPSWRRADMDTVLDPTA